MSTYCTEISDVYSETVRTARKMHQCDACDEAIKPGHQYYRIANIYDGNVITLKRCVRCQAIHKHLRTLNLPYDDTWPDEYLNCGDEYKDVWGTDPPEAIAKLAFWRPGDP